MHLDRDGVHTVPILVCRGPTKHRETQPLRPWADEEREALAKARSYHWTASAILASSTGTSSRARACQRTCMSHRSRKQWGSDPSARTDPSKKQWGQIQVPEQNPKLEVSDHRDIWLWHLDLTPLRRDIWFWHLDLTPFSRPPWV